MGQQNDPPLTHERTVEVYYAYTADVPTRSSVRMCVLNLVHTQVTAMDFSFFAAGFGIFAIVQGYSARKAQQGSRIVTPILKVKL